MASLRGSVKHRRAAQPRSGARRSGAVRRSRRAGLVRSPVMRARSHLRNYRKASLLAVALTGFLLLFMDPGAMGAAQEGDTADDTVAAVQDSVAADSAVAIASEDTIIPRADSLARESTKQATRTLQILGYSFYGLVPKIVIALGIFLLAGLMVRVLRPLLRRVLGQWQRADAFTALFGIGIWLVAIGVAFSVLAGDIRALLGSLGLIGLALSWALQTPIESFTGWMLNSFRGYYRVGDRIAVGDVFGDVAHIDLLTTTVWEYGGPDRPPGFVQAEQPTGRIITFPNNEVLTGTVVNYTRDFPYVWDELVVAVANESELRYAMQVLGSVARELLGEYMAEPAKVYQTLLRRTGLEMAIAGEPQVFVSLTEWGTNLTIRYLVGAREKRRWKSELSLRVMEELNRPENRGRIISVYPRRQIQVVGADGVPTGVSSPTSEVASASRKESIQR